MQKRRRLNIILAFSFAQLAWFALLGLWIYWYVSNYLNFVEVGERIAPQLVLETRNIAILVGGICLLAAVATIMAIIFGNFNQQMKVTGMYDSFIANVSHELKSPLASIQLHIDTLSSRTVPEDKRREFLELMRQDARRLNELIDSILEISGLEENKQSLHPIVYEAEPLLHSLIEETVEQFNLPPEAVDIRGRALGSCLTDRQGLKIVFNNLFDNAIKYSNGAVHLTVDIGLNKRWFTIDVADRGIGIPKQDQIEVFKKFRRLYREDSPSVKGTGLGLYRVWEIVRQHRGRVKVISEGKNQGTTFRIELPVTAAAREYTNRHGRGRKSP